MDNNGRSPVANEATPSRRRTNQRGILAALALLAAIGALIVFGNHEKDKAFQQSITGDSALIDKGQQYIAALTKDPSSVQFQGAREVHHCVLGKLNAKNSYGAYVGFQDFYYDDDRGVGQIDPGSMNDASGQFDIDAAKQSMGYSDGLLQCTSGHAGDAAYGQGNATAAQ